MKSTSETVSTVQHVIAIAWNSLSPELRCTHGVTVATFCIQH